MIHDRKEFGLGLLLITAFVAVLVLIFAPLHAGGRNTLDFLDSTFNSISKASAYYIPAVREKASVHAGRAIEVTVKAADAGQAQRMQALAGGAGFSVAMADGRLKLAGDLGQLLGAVLGDADAMFHNDGAALSGRYGFDEKRALYDWHQLLGAVAKDLTRQERFAEAQIIREVLGRAIEPAYNYYRIEAVPMSEMIWVAVAALAGYVLYTVWYGFAVMFLFEGWGLRLKH
jgi:hypothetical protein